MVESKDDFHFAPMEKILGEAGFEQNLEFRPMHIEETGNSGSNLDIQFIRPVRIFSLDLQHFDLMWMM